MTAQPGDVDTNLAEVHRLLGEAHRAGAELICFPELCLSGYMLDRHSYHPKLLQATKHAITQLVSWAARTQTAVIVGSPRCDGDQLFNSVFLLEGRGEAALVYDKTHLDRRERQIFAPGDRFVVSGNRIGLACCYDIAFPEVSRALALQGALTLVFPMAWETRRAFAARRVRAARATENTAYLICANQVGTSGEFSFSGDSCIIDPLGETVCAIHDSAEWAITTLDLAGTWRMRATGEQTYPFFNDRRHDLY